MAKGQMRTNKEKKKPKAEWNKKQKGGPTLSPLALAREPAQPGQNPFGKKSEAQDGEAFALAGGPPRQSTAWGRRAAQKPALLRSNHPARRGMVGICFPRRAIADRGLIAPRHPSFARAAREQLEEWPPTARLDERVLLVRLARVLALARRQQIHLPPSRRQRARVLATHAEQNELGHVAEIEADPAPVGAAILAHLVPDDVGLVAEAPCLHHREPVGQERVRAPQIEVRSRRGELVDRQRHDLRERHGAITRQAPVLGRDLSGLVDELPRRIGEDGAEAALADDVE